MARVVEIDSAQAERLRRLAEAKGVGEDVLVTQALELLFHRNARDEAMAEDLSVLREMDSEQGGVLLPTGISVRNPGDFVMTHAVPVVSHALETTGDKP